MKYIKITNIKQHDGNFDYKGLDMTFYVVGSQFCFDEINTAYQIMNEVISDHSDVHIITKEEYELEKKKYENFPRSKTEIEILQEEFQEIKTQNAQMLLALVINDLI